MRKTLYIEILIGFVTLVGIISLVYFKIIKRPKKEFTLYTLDKYGICFLVEPTYNIIQFKDRVFYSGGKNTGTLQIYKRKIDPTFKMMPTSEIPMGIHKIKNYRIFEYQVTDNFVLRDEFEYAKRLPGNLIPRKLKCEELKSKLPVVKLEL